MSIPNLAQIERRAQALCQLYRAASSVVRRWSARTVDASARRQGPPAMSASSKLSMSR